MSISPPPACGDAFAECPTATADFQASLQIIVEEKRNQFAFSFPTSYFLFTASWAFLESFLLGACKFIGCS
jgi:hypothetical protein